MENKQFKLPRTFLDALVTEKALAVVNGREQEALLEVVFEQNVLPNQVKNVCAKLSVGLSDEIDSLCNLLNIKKRSFIEAALMDAVNKTNEVIESEGVFDYLRLSSEIIHAESGKEE